MIITREINGVKHDFELSDVELYIAYEEQQYIFDLMDCKDVLEHMYWEEEWLSDALENEELLEKMARVYRKNMCMYDMNPEYALGDALEDPEVRKILSEYKEEKR